MVVSFGGYTLILNAYAYILGVLGVGGYRDEQQALMGDVNWGDRHFTCFQFGYDWRRDIVESAQKLDTFIKEKKKYKVILSNSNVRPGHFKRQVIITKHLRSS